MSSLTLSVPAKLKQLYQGKARYKGLSGGRGSSKSYGMVDYILFRLIQNPLLNTVCLRQVQKSIKYSSKKLLEDRIKTHELEDYFEILQSEIRLKKGSGIIIFQGLQDHTADSIKSLEGFDICFVEEAQSITEFSLDLLTPTIRKNDAELLFSWNPRYPTDAIEELFNGKSNAIKIHINYTDNPFCPDSIKEEAEEMKELNLQKYNHVYLGAFATGDELAIIREEWIRSSIKAYRQLNIKPSGTRRLGYDVADGTDAKGEEIKNDSNAFVEFHGNVMLNIDEWFAGKDEILTSSKRVHRYSTDKGIHEVNYDNIGVGASVGSIFKDFGSKFDYRPFTASNSPQNKDSEYKDKKTNGDMFRNIKAQAWITISDRFIKTHNYITKGEYVDESEMIFIDDSCKYVEKLITELSSPRELKDGNGKIMVESKDSLKKRGIASPNIADAFIMGAFILDELPKQIGTNKPSRQSFF